MLVCLRKIEETKDMFQLIDCKTREAINLNPQKTKAKTKRVPSKYNLHMKSCLKEEKGDIKERFRTCVNTWRESKK